jgi:hypothetical protein
MMLIAGSSAEVRLLHWQIVFIRQGKVTTSVSISPISCPPATAKRNAYPKIPVILNIILLLQNILKFFVASFSNLVFLTHKGSS